MVGNCAYALLESISKKMLIEIPKVMSKAIIFQDALKAVVGNCFIFFERSEIVNIFFMIFILRDIPCPLGHGLQFNGIVPFRGFSNGQSLVA